MYSYFASSSVAAAAKTLLISLLSSQWLPLGDFISLCPFRSLSLARRCGAPYRLWRGRVSSELGESSGEGFESLSFQEKEGSIFISSLAHD